MHRYRYVIIACWAALAVLGGGLSGGVFDKFGKTPTLSPHAESKLAADRAKALVPDTPIIIAVVSGKDVYDEKLARAVLGVDDRLRALDWVTKVDDLYTNPAGQRSGDNQSMTIRVKLRANLTEEQLQTTQDTVARLLHTIPAPTVLVGGKELVERAFIDQSAKDLALGEGVSLALLLVALYFVFGGLRGAAIPLLVALTSICTTLLALLGLARVAPVSEYTVNIVTLLGLGLAVDYSLLLVARFREERAAGAEVRAAIERAVATAGRSVVVSGLIVAVSIGGLLFFDEPLLRSMALGGLAVVLVAVAASVTLVPALLGVWGAKLPLPRERSPFGLLGRIAGFAQRRPGPVALVSAVALVALALPFTGVILRNSDATALPRSQEARRAFDAYDQLTGGRSRPVEVVAETPKAAADTRTYLNRLLRLPGVQVQLNDDAPSTVTMIELTVPGASDGPEARALVATVRALRTPFKVLVGGEAAEVVDYQASVARKLPIAALLIVLATFALLYALTRSLVVPLKSLLLNALSLGASLGLLALIFGRLDLTTPVLLFVFVFGLSTDYEVFLLSRMREQWDKTRNNDQAVLAGITRSGPVVTAAALCICLVFAGFAAGQLVAVRELGVGMLIAVLIDVTVVRGLLLPAAMTLLGDWNWWSGKK